MESKIIFMILLCCLNICKAQKKDRLTNNDKTMEKFEKNKYGELTLDPEFIHSKNDTSYLSRDKKIRIISEDETIQVEEKEIDSPYELTKSYYTKNNQLKLSINKFYSLSYGFLREYDENGNLIKEKDLDKNYKFSINDLIKKMKNEFGIDITDINKTQDVYRYSLNKKVDKAFYEVSIKSEIGGEVLKQFLIDGNTGKLLYRINQSPEEKKGDIYNQYLKSLQQK